MYNFLQHFYFTFNSACSLCFNYILYIFKIQK
nr:MAG TPA: hypothetical protein [Caudoviricetes sp.]